MIGRFIDWLIITIFFAICMYTPGTPIYGQIAEILLSAFVSWKLNRRCP